MPQPGTVPDAAPNSEASSSSLVNGSGGSDAPSRDQLSGRSAAGGADRSLSARGMSCSGRISAWRPCAACCSQYCCKGAANRYCPLATPTLHAKNTSDRSQARPRCRGSFLRQAHIHVCTESRLQRCGCRSNSFVKLTPPRRESAAESICERSDAATSAAAAAAAHTRR